MNKKVYEDTLQIASLALFDIKLGENGLDLNGNDVKQTAKNAFDEIEKSKNEIARRSQHSEPKLSIPKKIAKELDTILKEYPGWIYEGFHRLASRSLMMWCENNSGFNNCVAYLAGKALGVELVEVTDE